MGSPGASGRIREGGTRSGASIQVCSSEKEEEGLGTEDLPLAASEFSPNILLIDDPIMSFLKAFLKLNK